MAASHAPAGLDPERDFERLRPPARRRFLARARRAGQAGRVDLDAAADDAYQEAWLELQRRPDAFAIEHDPAGYLAGIMWHRFHRLELRPARLETKPLEDNGPADFDGPHAVVERRQTLAAVHDALAELPDRERTALLLRAEGLGHDDVAATLGVSRRIARKLTERGRARLTHELESEARCASIASTLRAIGLGWPVRGDRRARLEDHVAHCVTCRATVAALRREGAVAAMPAVLADNGALGRLRDAVLGGGDGALGRGGGDGVLARLRDGVLGRGGGDRVLARLRDGGLGRGGGEALAAAAGAKLAAGCVAAGVCVVGVVGLAPSETPRADRAPRAGVVARAPAKHEAPPVAPDPRGAAVLTAWREQDAARRAQRAEQQSSRARVVTAHAQVRAAVERAQDGVARARVGAERARAGAERARVGADRAQAGAERAQAGAERAQAGAERARAAAPVVTAAGERATNAANRARDAADRVRDALARIGAG